MEPTQKLQQIQTRVQTYMQQGDVEGALQCASEAEALELPQSVAFAWYVRGAVAFRTADYDVAKSSLTRAMEGYQSCSDAIGQARAAGVLASVHTMVGDYPTAYAMFRTALDCFESVEDNRGLAHTLTGIGHVLNGTGDYPGALEAFTKACEFARMSGDQANVAGSRLNISSTLLNLGDVEGAHNELLRAREQFLDLGDDLRLALIDVNLGTTYLRLGEADEARKLLDAMNEELLEDSETWFGYHQGRAALLRLDGQHSMAKEVLQNMLEFASSHSMRAHEARTHEQLRDIAKDMSDFAGYVHHNEAYAALTEELKGAQTARSLSVIEKQRELQVIEREREKERAVLYSTLPRNAADRVIRGEVVSDEYACASVLFADVAAFTENSARYSPTEVVAVLAQLHTSIDHMCAECGVTKIKTIGDAYLAFAATDSAQENCKRTAILAVGMLRLRITWPDGTPLSLRIGMHVGGVSAGVIGTERLQYDVWGDTVNMASRLESSGMPGRIHVADTRYEVDGFYLEERGALELKGKGLVTTYWLFRH